MVTLQNLERRMVTYNLAHPEHTKIRKIPTVQKLKNGSSVGVFQKRRLPDSLTLLAREHRAGLPDTILQCPEVKAAIDATPPRLKVVMGPVVDRSQRPVPQAMSQAKHPKAGSPKASGGTQNTKGSSERRTSAR